MSGGDATRPSLTVPPGFESAKIQSCQFATKCEFALGGRGLCTVFVGRKETRSAGGLRTCSRPLRCLDDLCYRRRNSVGGYSAWLEDRRCMVCVGPARHVGTLVREPGQLLAPPTLDC